MSTLQACESCVVRISPNPVIDVCKSSTRQTIVNWTKDPLTVAGSHATSPFTSHHGMLTELAKCATSLKPTKAKVNGANCMTSLLGNGQACSHMMSPMTSHAGSPVAGSSTLSMNKMHKDAKYQVNHHYLLRNTNLRHLMV